MANNRNLAILGLVAGVGGLIVLGSILLNKDQSPNSTAGTPTTGTGTGTPTAGLISIQNLSVMFDGDKTNILFDIANTSNISIFNLRLQIDVEVNLWPDSNHDTACGSDINSTGSCFFTRGLPPVPIIPRNSSVPYSVTIDNFGTPNLVRIKLINPDGSLACLSCEQTACASGCNTIIR